MFRYIKSLIAAKRLFTLGGPIEGEIPILGKVVDGSSVILVLPANADTNPPGIQSMFWDSRKGHALVEAMHLPDVSTRGFRILKLYGKQPEIGDRVWLSGWLGEQPSDFGLKDVSEISMPNGTSAYFSAGDDNWVIHVHGRNASRAETLRNFATIDGLGFSQLSIALESDPPPAGLGEARSHLGTTEWKQVESAIRFAYQRGSKRIVLFGFSLGAMITGECLRRSSLGQTVAAVVFDSPLIDFESTLNLQAIKAGQKNDFGSYGLRMIQSSRVFRFLGLGLESIPSLVRPLGRPALILYSETDGYVSMELIPKMRSLNPQAEFVNFQGGRHCRLYNQDPDGYNKALVSFLEKVRI